MYERKKNNLDSVLLVKGACQQLVETCRDSSCTVHCFSDPMS